MPIIAVARASYSHGRKIAESAARALKYRCISEEVVSLASQQYDIPENWLRRAVEDAPTLRDRFSYGKKKYIAYIRSALLESVANDNVVYHALAGHFLLEGIPNVLRVMISATMDERIKETMKQEKVSPKEALKIIEKFDRERKKWAMYFYGKDPWDLSLYDLGLVVGRLTVDDAVEKICSTVKLPVFQTSAASRKILENQNLAARIQSDLMNFYADIDVTADGGAITVHIQRSLKQEQAITEDIRDILMEMPGVKSVEVNVIPVY